MKKQRIEAKAAKAARQLAPLRLRRQGYWEDHLTQAEMQGMTSSARATAQEEYDALDDVREPFDLQKCPPPKTDR